MMKNIVKRIFEFVFVVCLVACVGIIVLVEPIDVKAEASAVSTTEYSITYHLDGGTNALKNPDVYTSEDSIVLKDATKEGYDFVGWFLDEEKTQKITTISNRTENLNLYAKFTPKSYTVTFDYNGGTVSSGVTITMDNTIGTTKVYSINNDETFDPYSYWIPQREGYVFVGWCQEGQLVGEKLRVSSNALLTAKWNQCTVNSIILGEWYDKIYNVEGWGGGNAYTDYYFAFCVSSISGFSSQLSNQGKGYQISQYCYVSGGYRELECQFVTAYTYDNYGYYEIYDVTNGKVLLEYEEEKNNFLSFNKGFMVEGGSLLKITVGVKHGSYGGYKPCYPKVTICLSEKSSCVINLANESESTQKFDNYITPPNVSKNGYDFLGWYDVHDNLMPDVWQYTEDQTFIAKWQSTEYNIAYNLDGGTNNQSNPSSYTIEDSITLKAPSRAGYTFKGWYSDFDFKTEVTAISKQTGDLTLYAKWEANSYELILDTNGGVFAPKVVFVSDGVEISSTYVYSQNTITNYRPNNKVGYIFAGWYKDASFTSLLKSNTTIMGDTTLYAKWIECADNIINIDSVDSFEVNINGMTERLYAFVPHVDGTIVVSSESNGLDLYGILYNATKSTLISADDISDNNLDFSYTYNVAAGQLYYIAVKGRTASTLGSATISIDWTGTSYTIGGNSHSDCQFSVVYDTEYSLSQTPVRQGYIFMGWFDEEDNQVVDGVWNFAANKTLVAKWSVVEPHTIVFKDLLGNVISSKSYYIGENIVAPDLPFKASDETYIYQAKWDNGYTGICAGDAVYSPIFDAKYIEYTIIFANEDGAELARETYHWGDTVQAPNEPTKDVANDYTYKYVFAGWNNTVADCEGDAIYTATYNSIPLKQWSLISHPNKTRYLTGESLDLTGLILQCEYNDDSIILVSNINPQVVSADLSTSGRKAATITIAGETAEIEIYVHDSSIVNIASSLYPQSSHNYSNNLDETKTFTYPGAHYLIITFDSQTSVENRYDYIYIYDGDGNQVAKYTGTTAANITLTITGDTFKVRLTSDSSNVKYGYAFSSIKANMQDVGDIVHIPVVDPATVTCTQDGLTEGSHCDICGDILVAQEEISALGHSYGEWYEIQTPTCTEAGIDEHECSVCQNKETRSVNALDHTEVIDKAVASTCTETGLTEGKHCSVCNEVLVAQEVVNELGHTEVIDEAVASTCTETGLTEGKHCSVCNEVLVAQEVVNELGHDYNSVVTAPTCMEKGYTTYTCTRCSDSYVSDYVDALGHTEVIDEAVDSTCTATGLTEGKHCSVCNEVLVEQEVTDKLGHNYKGVVTAPTCTEKGYTTYTCERCNDIYVSDYINALGHTEVIDEAVASTCTETGLTEGKHCSVCNEVLISQEVVDALGHDYGDFVNSGNATHTKVCSNDNSHIITEGCNYTNCSSNNDGTKTGTCVCGDIGIVVDEAVLIVVNNVVIGLTEYGKTLENIVIPDSVTSIGYGAFYGCDSLVSVIIGNKVSSIGEDSFKGSALTEVVIPDSVTSIGKSAFANCTNLTSVIIGKGVTTLTLRIFYYCRSLTSVVMSDSVTTIGGEAFYNCTRLTSIVIPDSVTTIGVRGFYNCNGLTSVYYKGTVEEWAEIGVGSSNSHLTSAIRYYYFENKVNLPSNCGNYWYYNENSEIEVKTIHSYEIVETAPTCTEQGYTTYTCERCNDSYVSDYINALGHSASSIVVENNVEPDCTNKGSYDNVIYCTVCGEELSREKITVNELGHTEVIDEAVDSTCTATGLTEGKHCSVCNEVLVEQEVTDKLGHNYKGVVTAPTCTEKGYTTYTCERCNDSYVSDYINALGHSAGSIVVENNVEPDCTNKGSYDNVIYCTVCGEELSREKITVNELGHTEVIDEAVASTCTETGLTEGKHCSVCNEVLVEQEVTDKLGHNYKGVVTAPTCTEKGYTTYTCERCNDSYVSDCVDALGHTEVIDEAVVSTCTETGLTEGKHCSVCNEVLVAQEVVDELGHAEATATEENRIEPTCMEDGSYDNVVYCSVCGEELWRETKVIDKLGHSYDNACDKTCVKCEEERTTIGHIDVDKNECCDECGANMPKQSGCGSSISDKVVWLVAISMVAILLKKKRVKNI